MRHSVCLALLLPVLTILCWQGDARLLTVYEACADFAPGSNIETWWSHDDCLEAWRAWSLTIDETNHGGYHDRRVREVELRATSNNPK